MDRFRVRALTGILKNESNPYYREIITNVLKMKLNILIDGYTKRDNTQDAVKFRKILDSLN